MTEVESLKTTVRNLQTDAVKNGTIRLRLVATQALLFAAENKSKQFTSFRFKKLVNTPSMADYTQVVNSRQVAPATEQAVADMLDNIINGRNAAVHYRSESMFRQEAIMSAQALINRHPRLRSSNGVEVLIIETYDDLKSCFGF